MPGYWLTAIARRLTRRDTFERLVSPAIADLQREAARGVMARARHYVAFAAVFACALARDFRFDLRPAFDASALRHVWSWTALWTLGFGALAGWMTFRDDLRVLGPGAVPTVLIAAALKSLVVAFSVAMAAATFYLVRRGSTTRTVIATTLVLFATALATLFVIHPLRMSVDRELYDFGQALNADAPSVTSLLAVWLSFHADGIDGTLARGRDFRDALGVINGALMGMVLAASRQWRVALTAVMLVAATLAVGMFVMQFESGMLGHPPSYAFQSWRSLVISFMVAGVWALATTRSRRRRRAEQGPDSSGLPLPS